MENQNIVLENKYIDSVIQFSKTYGVTKKTQISVPANYLGLIYIDEKIVARINNCKNLKFIKEYGKEYLNKNLRVAFVSTNDFYEILWGFGNLNIKNDKVKFTYRVGTNGKLLFEIKDYMKLINAYGTEKDITLEKIREKLIETIKTVGVPILNKLFADTSISTFEVNSFIPKIREEMQKDLMKEIVFERLGINIKTVIVSNVHINEEDIETIRKNINNTEDNND